MTHGTIHLHSVASMVTVQIKRNGNRGRLSFSSIYTIPALDVKWICMKITKVLNHILEVQTHKEYTDRLKTNKFHIKHKNKIYYMIRYCGASISIHYHLNCRDRLGPKLWLHYESNTNILTLSITSECSRLHNYTVHQWIECELVSTEEDFFMQSTMTDFGDLTLEDFNIIKKIFYKYHRKVRYGK